MQIDQLTPLIEDVWNDLGFITLLESHLTYFRKSANVRIANLTSQQSYKREGDFYGLLDDLQVEKKFHYIVLRFNGYKSSADFKGTETYILYPDFEDINRLKELYQSKD